MRENTRNTNVTQTLNYI